MLDDQIRSSRNKVVIIIMVHFIALRSSDSCHCDVPAQFHGGETIKLYSVDRLSVESIQPLQSLYNLFRAYTIFAESIQPL